MLALLVSSATARADFKALASPGPLARSHADLDNRCEACHVPFKGIPESACLACHQPIGKRIADKKGPHAGYLAEGKKCASCHGDHKGRNHVLSPPLPESGFDHAARAGVPLDGKHATIACKSCHTPKPTGGLTWIGIASFDECASCHKKDPHNGQLGPRCAACHAARAWKPTTRTIADHKVPMTGGHTGLSCQQCHKQGRGLAQNTACGDCHEQKHGGTKAPCKSCHNVQSWKSASFTHDFCTCILPGKHQTATCLACHPAFKFKPTPFACAGCHLKDRKHDDLGACSRCHSALSWKTRTFDHNQPRVGFVLAGKHLEVGCENCHTQKRGGVIAFKAAPRECGGCHKVPAHGDFGACEKCHVVEGWDKPRFSHDKTAFPLDGHHVKVTCQTCHAKFKKGEFKPGPNECALCHGDPHRGQFQRGSGQRSERSDAPENSSDPQSRLPLRMLLARNGPGIVLAAQAGGGAASHTISRGRGCKDCHTTRAWLPSTVDVAKHATFGYALAGKHAAVPCIRCHVDSRFVGTPTRCAECHLDRHGGRFGSDCARCHDERGFRPVPNFNHEQTGFALVASHTRVPCAGCHGSDRSRLRGVTHIGCATCHTPRHGSQFGSECARCHQPTRFSDVPPFDHAKTGFPLDRRHAAVRCTTCHDVQRAPHLDGQCRTCHGDPHRGRTLTECGECHRPDVWHLIRFDHDRTEFPLRGKHFVAVCRDCHPNDQYTGVRTECFNCHRGDRLRANGIVMGHNMFSFDCIECHSPFKW
jgi:hypothetical protein